MDVRADINPTAPAKIITRLRSVVEGRGRRE
jgi:hypothetical protein